MILAARMRTSLSIAVCCLAVVGTEAQAPAAQPPPRPRPAIQIDDERARELYVSKDPKDHAPGYDFERDVRAKAEIDKRYADASHGVMDFKKVTYRTSVGDLDIPAYLFQPLTTRGPKTHAAMVWVHGGVHGNWGINMFPFVKEAVERGYVIICPEYRGSTGYGERHHTEIDYGGYEIDDVMSAVEHLKTLPHVDPERLGIMGWSHGGYITLFSVFRDKTPFKAAAAIVPVTNLVFRLSFKGPRYQRSFATQKRIQGLPFEKPDLYIERSPLYHVDKLGVPLLVHVATNDTDVNFVEDQQIIDALRSRKPDLAETKIYVDPTPGPTSGGHTFSRRVNMKTLERDDSPEQRDSWNRTWAFFEWHLRSDLDKARSKSTSAEEADAARGTEPAAQALGVATVQPSEAVPAFDRMVRPVLERQCRPCHFEGGVMHGKLPFDRAETIRTLGERLFTRIRDPKDQATIRAFLRTR